MSAPTGVRVVEAQRCYIGAYTVGDSPGRVSSYDLDPRTGEMRAIDSVETSSASFLAVHPSGTVVYAASERTEGSVAAYAVKPGGRLDRTGPPRATGGAEPCHVSVAPGGRWLAVANYRSGSVAVLPLDTDGWLPGERSDLVQHHGSGPDPSRQEHPHAHNVRFSPAGRLYAVDLGADTILTYELDTNNGRLENVAARRTAAGAGPRHLAFDTVGHAFLACELDSTVSAYDVDAGSGALTLRHTVPAVAGAFETDGPRRNYPAEIAASGDDRFVYVSNRGTDVITVFAVEDGGRLRAVADVPCGGECPRNFVLTGDMLLVANQNSGGVSVFRVDGDTGVPEPTDVTVEVSGAACVITG